MTRHEAFFAAVGVHLIGRYSDGGAGPRSHRDSTAKAARKRNRVNRHRKGMKRQ